VLAIAIALLIVFYALFPVIKGRPDLKKVEISIDDISPKPKQESDNSKSNVTQESNSEKQNTEESNKTQKSPEMIEYEALLLEISKLVPDVSWETSSRYGVIKYDYWGDPVYGNVYSYGLKDQLKNFLHGVANIDKEDYKEKINELKRMANLIGQVSQEKRTEAFNNYIKIYKSRVADVNIYNNSEKLRIENEYIEKDAKKKSLLNTGGITILGGIIVIGIFAIFLTILSINRKLDQLVQKNQK